MQSKQKMSEESLHNGIKFNFGPTSLTIITRSRRVLGEISWIAINIIRIIIITTRGDMVLFIVHPVGPVFRCKS